MTNTLYLPELREMLSENNEAELREFCEALHPARTAEFMEGLTAEESWRVLQYAAIPLRVEIFGFFDQQKQHDIVRSAARQEIAELIGSMPADDRVDLLNEIESAVVEELMPLVPAEERRDIQRLSAYPEGTAGAVMTSDYARFTEDMTVGGALAEITRQAQELETIYYMYVVDQEGHLHGLVTARELLSALRKPDTPIGEVMERDLVTVNVTDDQEEVARKVARYNLMAVPVVDDEHRMLGIITHDDVLDVMVEEATEDALHMGGMATMVDNYLEAPFATIWRKRTVWLSCLFVAELFTFSAMAYFQRTIDSLVVLAFFVPLCISTGGNSGSQAATLITRALALGQVTLNDWWRVLRHELLMGLALGLSLGCIGFVRAAATPGRVLENADRWMLALTVSQSVAGICIWGTLVGALLPLVFRRLGIDPGYASSPFVATFVDVTGIFIFFSIASLYLL